MKKLLCTVLTALCLLGCAAPVCAEEAGFANFRTVATYGDGLFTDVDADGWYAEYVAAVYELGLMKGTGDGRFNVDGNVTLAETMTMAARLHSIWYGGGADFVQGTPWYQVYADYCLTEGIVTAAPTDAEATAPATRAVFAAILSRALPDEALPAWEAVSVPDNSIPDVKMNAPYAAEIYKLYRAGVLNGSDERGTFAPETPIGRSSVAAIVSRMVYVSLRVKFELAAPVYPDLTKQATPAGDDYFADAAMIGNSLVDGMQLYSGLNMTYFGQQSATVKNYKLDRLLQKQYGKVYIELGINDMGTPTETYIEGYRALVERIRAAMPDAEIYILSMTPVTKAKAADGFFSMSAITARNAALYALAGETECWFVDCCTPLCGEDGYLLPGYAASWDGAHLKETAGYVAWADILRTYYV